ncbi:Superfamily II DNA or RNA helicase [Pelagirhabdus alkalitolerans]|uniref:Superfamily II DNA or RNA helicase n=1 Tax=Pelagirhabdus alkalitolerans TaxID=1612202 RepID=A0A1G6GNT5_9BACI|nr:Superfamily II DNA or RNA helicase [Pelagirhabdus alkalitolerans]
MKEAGLNGTKGKIITSTYLNFTDAKSLEKIKTFENIDMKIFMTDEQQIGFHTKAYIFEYDDFYKIFIGSSNITQSAMKSNVEWNVEVVLKRDDDFVKEVLEKYEALWDQSSKVDESFIQTYRALLNELKNKFDHHHLSIAENHKYVVPNAMQRRAVDNLDRLRKFGETKGLVIAATGTGKTYMSAFDVRNVKPKRLLFVVHREEVLRKAKETFETILINQPGSFGYLTGTKKDFNADYLFANIHTLSKHYLKFQPRDFDYIIYDEAHHVTSPIFQDVINYFDPEFTLGMTATPERSDGQNVFDLFDQNVALEVRLHEALEEELIIPFHYFGVTDIGSVDLSDIDVDDIAEVTKRLKVNERVDFIIENLEFYSHDNEKRKCVGFCVSRDHAAYMAEEFNKRGYTTAALDGNDSSLKRSEHINRLEDDHDPLSIIFTVDIFNEGIDIPSINTVLMLRPTNSPIVFIQQLGRGLRKHPDKEFLTVLDFIGNHNKTFLIALALRGNRYYDKDSLKVAIATDFANIPGNTHIQLDKISQERILAQIDAENFYSMKYLKQEYFEFKHLNNGKTPLYLMDYMKYDGSPDPIKFIEKEKTYLNFVAKVEKDEQLKLLLYHDKFERVLKDLSSMLPLKRVYEFIILRYLMNHQEISMEKAREEILKVVDDVATDSIYHAFEYLNHAFFDRVQRSNKEKLCELHEDTLIRTETFRTLLETSSEFNRYIEDVLDYGIFRYSHYFDRTDYGIPHFKLYEQYKMVDAAHLSNYRKIHSSFRGQGLLVNGNDYFLFVDLHKEATIKDSINYNDKFIDRQTFQWETPNSTKQSSERGENIIFNNKHDIRLHLFVRKYKEIEKNKSEPYIYIGKGDVVDYSGEQPIQVMLRLEHEVPSQLYVEFTEKV